MKARRCGRVALVAASFVLSVAAVEATLRVIDGQPLTSLTLGAAPASVADGGQRREANVDLQYMPQAPLAPGVDRGWYREEPTPAGRFDLDPMLAARLGSSASDSITPFFEFNLAYLKHQTCSQRTGRLGSMTDFFYFEPIDGRPYPTYRHLTHANPPSWFVTNNFGWRGPDIALNRASDTVRIAFVGASTTVDAYSVPFSHPELTAHWLNLWASRRELPLRFEVINAGRTGIDSTSIAAIVRTELAPIDPDFVVFYEGANQFSPGSVLRVRMGRLFLKPTATLRERTSLERYSAIVRRLLSAWMRTGGGHEPRKPPSFSEWPPGVSEAQPDPHDPRLPMDLPRVVRDLDDMRSAVADRGGELVLTSFVWLAFDGMRLDPARHAQIFRQLNDSYWPIPYAHIRRMADFQNRVFERYARQHMLPFIDVAREYPKDPDLFGDAIHMTYPGLRLEAWIYLQHLANLVEARLRDGRLPRPAAAALSVHPAFNQPERRLITRRALEAGCS